jgi:hypothetical protein
VPPALVHLAERVDVLERERAARLCADLVKAIEGVWYPP